MYWRKRMFKNVEEIKNISKVRLCFENVEICDLTKDMFDFIAFTGIEKDLYVYGGKRKNKALKRKTLTFVTCRHFFIDINEAGLKQHTSFCKGAFADTTLKERLSINKDDLVSITFLGKRDKELFEINVPWNDENDYSNSYQKTIFAENKATIEVEKGEN